VVSTDFTELLKALRQRRDLTQEQLAHEIGVSFSTVNLWENGRRRPQPFLAKKIFELAHLAGLNPVDFKDPNA
jgi:putative transcriptional regulator